MQAVSCIRIFCFIFLPVIAGAQIVSGPMLGPAELKTAKLWLEVKPGSDIVLWYWKKGERLQTKKMMRQTDANAWFSTQIFELVDLEPGTTYEYEFLVNAAKQKKPSKADGQFSTKELWQWRKPAPDFSFLAGSCTYLNEAVYDRPGKPYGGDSSIFQMMAKEQSAFMLWLGDNWYTREVDYADRWGMWRRASRDRSFPVLQPFLKSMSHLAIWDDHDYGPNDMGKSFILKETAREVFRSYWPNPSFGMEEKGIYTQWSYSDVDFFLLDDRWWRSADELKDSVNGLPNPTKRMWGTEQMEWLKQSLLSSRATFKILVNGSQVLNQGSPYDKLLDFPVEYQELMDFLQQQKINGVVFMSGDRHHTEIIRMERREGYPLYDITISPLTSGTHVFGGPEKNNPQRVLGIDQKQNYGRLNVSGKRGSRRLQVSFLGVKGELLGEWSVEESALKY